MTASSSSMSKAITTTDIPGLPVFRKGKVRDVYDLGDTLLIIATDRISAFDVIMPNGIPDKGKILTGLTVFWLDRLGVENHLITDDIAQMPEPVGQYADQLAGRALLVKKLKIFPVECIVRGYLAGSGLKSYRASGEICGLPLPAGLVEAFR